jgi:hypothetical protein
MADYFFRINVEEINAYTTRKEIHASHILGQFK